MSSVYNSLSTDLRMQIVERRSMSAMRCSSLMLSLGLLLFIFSVCSAEGTLLYVFMVSGVVLFVVGLARLLFGCKCLYDRHSGRRVFVRDYYSAHDVMQYVFGAIDTGSFVALGQCGFYSSGKPFLMRAFSSEDASFVALQFFHYESYQYLPMDRTLIRRGPQASVLCGVVRRFKVS